MSRNIHDILIKPLVSEKSMALMAENKYTFQVAKNANKIEIKQAVEDLFKVKVEAVTTRHLKGKLKRMGKYQGYRPNTKRAIVTLKEGDKIEVFPDL